MSYKQKRILNLLSEGKEYFEICQRLSISKSNLHTTIYQMKKKGVDVKKKKTPSPITPRQRAVLVCYMEQVPITEIAARLGVSCQTVMNYGAEGFKRLGLTTPGVDRVTALHDLLKPPRVTMDDPEFN